MSTFAIGEHVFVWHKGNWRKGEIWESWHDKKGVWKCDVWIEERSIVGAFSEHEIRARLEDK